MYVFIDNRFILIAEFIYYYFKYVDGFVIIFYYFAVKIDKFIVYSFLFELDEWEIFRLEIVMKYRFGGGQYGEVYEGVWKKYNRLVVVKILRVGSLCVFLYFVKKVFF